MSQAADLYALIRFYATRTRAPSFTVEAFLAFLEKYAKRYAAERPDLAPWAQDAARKVWAELPSLSESGRCPLVNDERGTVVSVPQFYVDVIQQAYRTAEDAPELPFPDETSLKVVVPPAQLRTVGLDVDFTAYLGSPQGGPLPVIKLIFPEGAGSALILSGMIPKKLLELSLLKIRHYLRSHNNKDYVQHKLTPAFQGKESQLKDALNQLMVRPFDSMSDLEKAGDFSFPFWAYFSSLVRGDIRKKNDKLPEDNAALQAVYVVEVFNNYYKGRAQKAKESETALRNLDVQLDKSPFYYTIDDIVRFVDTKGIPLLGQYDKETLEDFIKTRTTAGDLNKLPDLLIVRGLGGERWYVKKAMILNLCVKLIGEARPKIKNALSQRWFKLMGSFRSEPSMESDEAFDRELSNLTASMAPVLAAVLREKTLYLAHEELEGTEAGVPEAGRLFFKGALAPMSELFLLARKDLLVDVRMLLPFWYTIPVISDIIAFFKRLGDKKKTKKKAAGSRASARQEDAEEAGAEESRGPDVSKARRAELKQAARKAEKQLVPEGYTLDAYLKELEDRWNRILSEGAKRDLTEDVEALVRDYLRRISRTIRAANFTPERIAELADSLAETPALLKLPARESLRLYIQLYMVKLVLKS